MTRDKLRPLYRFLGDSDAMAALQTGDRLIKELEEEIATARKQIGIIREILAPYREAVSKDGLAPTERGEHVRQAALTLVRRGNEVVTVEDVITYLRDEKGLVLDVGRPASVVATVLAKAKEFDRVDTGQFRPNALAFDQTNNSGEAAELEPSVN